MRFSQEMPPSSEAKENKNESKEKQEALDNSRRIGLEIYNRIYVPEEEGIFSQKVRPVSKDSSDAAIFSPRGGDTIIATVPGVYKEKHGEPVDIANAFLDAMHECIQDAKEKQDEEYVDEVNAMLRGFATAALNNNNFRGCIAAAQQAGILEEFKSELKEKANSSSDLREKMRQAFADSSASFADYV